MLRINAMLPKTRTRLTITAVLVSASLAWVSAYGATPMSAKSAKARKAVVSPYARAAQVRARAGNPPVGHAPTMVQGMGKPRKPHAGAPSK